MTVENDTDNNTVYTIHSGGPDILPILLRWLVYLLFGLKQILTLGFALNSGPHIKLGTWYYAGHLSRREQQYCFHHNKENWQVTFVGFCGFRSIRLGKEEVACLNRSCRIEKRPE